MIRSNKKEVYKIKPEQHENEFDEDEVAKSESLDDEKEFKGPCCRIETIYFKGETYLLKKYCDFDHNSLLKIYHKERKHDYIAPNKILGRRAGSIVKMFAIGLKR